MLYELRIYTAAADRIDALNAHFRDHTVDLFARHGIGVAGVWTNRADPNQLICICVFENEERMKAAWEGFRNDPDRRRTEARERTRRPAGRFRRKRRHGPDRLFGFEEGQGSEGGVGYACGV